MKKKASNNNWRYVAALGVALALAPAFSSKASADDATPGSTTQPAVALPASEPPVQDLRQLLGIVNSQGLKRVDVPQVPNMALRGFIQPHGGEPIALLELTDQKQLILVHKGTKIPITVTGHISPAGHTELAGLDDGSRVPGTANPVSSAPEQSQIILEVTNVSPEGVTVTAGQERQPIIIH
jgi:hypothetical protein